MEFSSLIKFLGNPQKRSGGTHTSAVLHNYVQHLTTECWVLYRLVHCRIKERTLELSQQEVQRKPLPNHKGKDVAVVVICVDPKEDKEENPALLAVELPLYSKAPNSKICLTSWGSQQRKER